MSKLLYNISVFGYYLLIQVGRLFSDKARKFIDGRKTVFSELRSCFQDNTDKVLWFHAASLGEFEQGRPIIERIKDNYPEIKILVTFFSPSGYEIRKNYAYADCVTYLPIDSRRNARKFIEIVKPTMAVFVKYEFWYHFIHQLHRYDVLVLSVSSIFRQKQLAFHPMGYFFRGMLRMIKQYFVQDERSVQLLKSIGINQVEVSGDTRFDRVIEIAEESKEIEVVENFKNDIPIMVLGSAWPIDIQFLLPVLNEFVGSLRIIYAPHNIHDREMNDFELGYGGKSIRYSNAMEEDVSNFDALVIDNIGMLSSLYKYASFAYVGGGFRGGLHNTLEAAVYGIPVFFGKHENNQKFKEAIGLITAGGGMELSEPSECRNIIKSFLADPELPKKIGTKSHQFVYENAGATDQIVEFMEEKIQKS